MGIGGLGYWRIKGCGILGLRDGEIRRLWDRGLEDLGQLGADLIQFDHNITFPAVCLDLIGGSGDWGIGGSRDLGIK